ncbi:TlpA family protein disulfide reductase [Alicyclobacillus curvatus]|nr:TlpA family protein disulfide reductase [Alicyclobacillus curvatus]
MKKLVLPIASILLLLAGCGTVSTTSAQSSEPPTNIAAGQPVPKSPLVGKSAPKFSLPTLDQKSTVSLNQLLGNKILVINAWASWCYPCQQETPDLVAMSKKYTGKVEFVGINMTSDDSVTDAKSFVHKYGISYPVLLDTKGAFSHDYQVIGYPTTFIVDPNGTIVNVHIGILTKNQIQQLINEAMNGAKPN